MYDREERTIAIEVSESRVTTVIPRNGFIVNTYIFFHHFTFDHRCAINFSSGLIASNMRHKENRSRQFGQMYFSLTCFYYFFFKLYFRYKCEYPYRHFDCSSCDTTISKLRATINIAKEWSSNSNILSNVNISQLPRMHYFWRAQELCFSVRVLFESSQNFILFEIYQ